MVAMVRFFRAKRKHEEAKRVHDEQLAEAEIVLKDLQERGERAIRTLDARHNRNHWRESITQMIQGAH